MRASAVYQRRAAAHQVWEARERARAQYGKGQLMPTLAQFQNGIFISGGYAGPPANAPVLRNAAGVSTFVLMAHDDVPLPAGTVLSASVTAAGGPPALANTPTAAPGVPVAEGASGGQTVPFGPPAPAAAGAGNAVMLPFVP